MDMQSVTRKCRHKTGKFSTSSAIIVITFCYSYLKVWLGKQWGLKYTDSRLFFEPKAGVWGKRHLSAGQFGPAVQKQASGSVMFGAGAERVEFGSVIGLMASDFSKVGQLA